MEFFLFTIINCIKNVHNAFYFFKNFSTLNLITSATSPLCRDLIVLVNRTKHTPHSHRRGLKKWSLAFIHQGNKKDPHTPHVGRWLSACKAYSTARIWHPTALVQLLFLSFCLSSSFFFTDQEVTSLYANSTRTSFGPHPVKHMWSCSICERKS